VNTVKNFKKAKIETNPSVFSLVNSVVNMTLPAFAAERRAPIRERQCHGKSVVSQWTQFAALFKINGQCKMAK